MKKRDIRHCQRSFKSNGKIIKTKATSISKDTTAHVLGFVQAL